MEEEKDAVVSPDAAAEPQQDTGQEAAPESVPEPVPETKRLRIVDLPIEQRRAYWRGTQEKSRAKAADKAEKTARKLNHAGDFSKKEARQVLIDRGLTHPHVIDCVVDLAEVAAQQYKIPFNWHLLRYGLRATLAALDGVNPADPAAEDHDLVGELISHKHLYSLWDFGLFRKDVSYEDFLRIRNECKKSCFVLGRDLLGKDFHEKPHKGWADFLPKLNPDTLKPGHNQEELKTWLQAQTPVSKDFLLMSSRNAYKSHFVSTFLTQLILCQFNLRCLILSERKDLSKGFVKLLRGTFEIVDFNEPTTFQQFFYEHCIPAGDGSVLSYESPMRSLTSLIEPTLSSSSMDSSVVGSRCDVLVGDDPVSNMSTGTEEACQSGIEKWLLAKKLVDVSGFTVLIGTPWTPTDVYADAIKNAAETGLQVKIDPAWKVKEPYFKDIQKMTPEERDKYLFSLTEDQVELLFESRLSFAFLRKELKSNSRLFVTQNLCVAIISDDDSLKVTFTEDSLRSHVRPMSFFGEAAVIRTVLAVDPAFSLSNIADYTSIAVLKIMRWQGKDIAYVVDIDVDRWRQSEIATHFVQAVQRWQPDQIIIEKTGPWEELRKTILTTAKARQTALPYIAWKNTSPGAGVSRVKVKRIKGLELLISSDRLFFAPSDRWNEICFDQFIKFHGQKSGPSRKEDIPDSIALAAEYGLPKFLGDLTPPKNPEQEKQEEEAIKQARLRKYQEYLFGVSQPFRPVQTEPEPEPENNPFLRVGNGALRRRS